MESQDEPFVLPFVLNDRYTLISVLRETQDSVYYQAQQKDTQRAVLVRSLRRSYASDKGKREAFMETARAATRVCLPYVATVLDFLHAEESLHIVYEGANGSPFGCAEHKLSTAEMAELLDKLSLMCLYLDAEHIHSLPFRPDSLFRIEGDFVIENMACVGSRSALVSNTYMVEAARSLLPFLDEQTGDAFFAASLQHLLQRVASMPVSTPLIAVYVQKELAYLFQHKGVQERLL